MARKKVFLVNFSSPEFSDSLTNVEALDGLVPLPILENLANALTRTSNIY